MFARPVSISLFRLALAIVAAVLVAACADERDDVARVIHQVADAAELRNSDGIMAFVARDYQDSAGRGPERIRALVEAQLQRPERIAIAFRKVRVGEIKGDRVTATLEAVLAEGDLSGQSLAEVLPDSMGAWRFTLQLRKRDGRWLVTQGEEKPIPPTSFLLGAPGAAER